VVDVDAQARTFTGCRPLQNLQIAGGIAERDDGPAANILWMLSRRIISPRKKAQ
jgi:hypothetical protein